MLLRSPTMTFSNLRTALSASFLAASCVAAIPACTTQQPVDSCEYSSWAERIVVAKDAATPIAGQCMRNAPDVLSDGTPNCVILEAHETGPCDCGTPGLQPVSEKHAGAIDAAKQDADPVQLACLCEVVPLTGEALQACRFDKAETPEVNGQPVNGYCYLDVQNNLGDPALAEACPQTEERLIRFVGDPGVPDAQQLFTYCAAKICEDAASAQ